MDRVIKQPAGVGDVCQSTAKGPQKSKQPDEEGRIEAILNKFEEKIARSEQLRLAHLSSVVQRASDETRKEKLLARHVSIQWLSRSAKGSLNDDKRGKPAQHLQHVPLLPGHYGMVAEVAFINQLLEEDKKLSLLQKLKDGELHP
eukprot:1161620-Pelagomonas_calceolata.AAC.7